MQSSIESEQIHGTKPRNSGEASVLAGDQLAALFPPLVDLAALWRSLTMGACFVLDSHCSDQHCFLMVERRAQPLGRRLTGTRVELLERILLGQSQKSVAIDFGLAVSTVALACSDCLRIMGNNHLSSRVPALMVMAVHAAQGLKLPPARAQRVIKGQVEHWVLSTQRPDRKLPAELTQAEEAVTRLLVEGYSHARIAELRASSPRTVANQLASGFRKMGISGRAELLAMLTHDAAESLTRDDAAQSLTRDDAAQSLTRDDAAQSLTRDDADDAAESLTRDSVTRDSVTRDSVTRDSVTRDSVTRDSVTRDSVTRDSVFNGGVPQRSPFTTTRHRAARLRVTRATPAAMGERAER